MVARKKAVTLQTISDELGLTIHTVSKALRGLPGMSEATRKAVIDRARELGYRTKEQEAGIAAERIPLANAKPRRFAMLINGDFAFHQMQLEGARIRLNELGHSLYTLLVPPAPDDRAHLEQWLEQNDLLYADGLFLTAAIPEWMESRLLDLPMPKVLLNYPPNLAQVDSVIWDVEHAVHLAMDELFRSGHRHILYVGDIEPSRGFRLRWKAFVEALSRHGLGDHADPDEHMTGGFADRAAWMESLCAKLRSGRYTAVLSAIPGMAEWVYVAAGFLKRDIPAELSIVGVEHDDYPEFPLMSRPHLLVREAGERAAELMLRRIANPLLPYEHVRLRGSFYHGNTVADRTMPTVKPTKN